VSDKGRQIFPSVVSYLDNGEIAVGALICCHTVPQLIANLSIALLIESLVHLDYLSIISLLSLHSLNKTNPLLYSYNNIITPLSHHYHPISLSGGLRGSS
jgi:hypothetical protein